MSIFAHGIIPDRHFLQLPTEAITGVSYHIRTPGSPAGALEEAVLAGPVLVATDGGSEAVHALQFAAAYAASENVPVEVVSVVAPLSDLPMPLPHRDELEHAHAQGVADTVRQHLRDIVGPVTWPIHVSLGRPAPSICTTARQRAARMVILGVASPGPEGNDTALELLHLAEKPVLVARSGRLPENAVVGIDFRSSSIRTAELALRLVRPGGRLHLVHVKPSLDFPAASVWDWGPCYECAVEGGFDELAARLAEGGKEVTWETRAGVPAEVLTAVAEDRDADLLAIGSDGYICNDRVVVGRVAREILTRSPLPVLATPVTTHMEGGVTDLARIESVA